MLTIRHITSEGESTFGVERVEFTPQHGNKPATVLADRVSLTGGTVFVMNDRGSTVAKYDLDKDTAR